MLDSIENLVRVGLQDIAGRFEIKEDLFDKYVKAEALENENLVRIIQSRDKIRDWKVDTPLGGPGTVLNAVALYSLVRHFQLGNIIETGVSGGFYTAFILAALQKNGRGELVSVELSDDKTQVGKLIPEGLKSDRWILEDGTDSIEFLKGQVMDDQLFCHDSLHTMKHMTQELMEFKRCELDDFFIYIDDQDTEMFWDNCIRMNLFEKPGYKVSKIRGKESRLKGHLGGFLRYQRGV